MADKPTDGTPETPASGPTPPRRRGARSETSASAKSPRGTGAAPKTRRSTKAATPDTPVGKTKAAVKATAAKAVAEVKPRVKRATKAVSAKVDQASAPSNRKKVLIGAAAAAISVAAGVAATLGRKKIAKVTNDTIDSVMGKDEPDKAPTLP